MGSVPLRPSPMALWSISLRPATAVRRGRHTSEMRISTWNLQWATTRSARGRRVAEVLAAVDADVIVLTEGCAAVLPAGGHIIDAGSDWGYRVDDPARRKVLMWSKHPWTDVDSVGAEELPPGRLVAGSTVTPIGEVRMIGVCVPWQGAHVTYGRRDRRPWEDHTLFLEALGPLLHSSGGPTVLAGDFNQRIPRTTQPEVVAGLLSAALKGFEVPTAGVSEPRLIDHIAHSPDLCAVGQPKLIHKLVDGIELSDHTGVHLGLALFPQP